MPTLNGIDLGKDIHTEGEHSLNRVVSKMARSRNDSVLLWEDMAGPQGFNLVGFANRGCFRKSIMDQVRALTVQPGAEFPLIYNGVTQTVCFRHWEGEVLSGDPLGGREIMTDDDFYTNVKIKLMEV